MVKNDGADLRREQIVKGAFNALRKHGLPDLSNDMVAAEAGVSRQLVRYHFPSHEGLMLEVCDYLAQLYRDALVSTAGTLDGPARVDMFLDFYFDLLDGTPKPRDDQAYDAMMALASRSEPVRETLAGQYRLVGQVLSHEFEVQYPELDRQSAEELSYLFVCLMYGHWKMVASLGFAEEHRTVSRQAMERLIRSYRKNDVQLGKKAPVWKKSPE